MENVKILIVSVATKAAAKALDVTKNLKEQIPSWATSKASSKNPEMIVTEYEDNYPNGITIESDRASARSYYARNDHTAIRWYVEPEVGHVDYAEVLTQIIGEASSDRKNKKFARHASSILHGRRQNWVLYIIVVHSSELVFLYENRKTEDIGYIQLDLQQISVPLTMCVGFESENSNEYEISYDPTDKGAGCHVFCRYSRERSNRGVTFLKDSTKAHVCMRRPKDVFDR